MKKNCILLFAMAAVIVITNGDRFGDLQNENVAYAAGISMVADDFDADFSYEMAQLTTKVIAIPSTDAESFKAEFAYATAQVTAKVMLSIPSIQRQEFAYGIARITSKIVDNQALDVEKAKSEFAYDIAQLTARIISHKNNMTMERKATGYPVNYTSYSSGPSASSAESSGAGAETFQREALIKNNAEVSTDPAVRTKPAANQYANRGYIDPDTYSGLINELTNVGRGKHRDNKVNIAGSLRYHYQVNNGPGAWENDSSGLRLDVGLDTQIYKDWRLYGTIEVNRSLVNYYNDWDLDKLYVAGKLGTSIVHAGIFNYMMADGNIYDSDFTGLRVDFDGPIRYTLGFGHTEYTRGTTVVTARYDDYDYGVEAGIYHNQMEDGQMNTIWTLGGKRYFNNFSLGAMYLGSSMEDSAGNHDGYVVGMDYGELKTWMPGTYNIFARYYDQPKGTYLKHGANGLDTVGDATQGFKGYGLGFNYTLSENLVGGTVYYDLEDKLTGQDGQTWWNQVTYYF